MIDTIASVGLRRAKAPGSAHRLRFTALRPLPRTLTMPEVVAVEQLYKEKLGSRAFGLNRN